MANPSVANVAAGKPMATGGVLVAPIDSTLPTDATTALDAAFKALGYIGEDGLTDSGERSNDKIKAWGNDIVLVSQTEFSQTYQFNLIEATNAEVLKVVYGDANVVTTAADATHGTQHAVKVNGDELPRKTFAFEINMGQGRKRRVVVPNAQVTEVGERTYVDGAPVAYPVTIEAFEDSSGNNAYQYDDDGKTTA